MDNLESFVAQFWNNVRKTDGACWEWCGSLDGKGYGRFPLLGRRRGAHRIAYEITHGPLARGMWVLHHCDNKRCVNPDHLYEGTIYDNTRDLVYRGRHGGANKTHCPRGHPYDAENTIYRLKPRGRLCRACRKIHNSKEYRTTRG